jgi:hypothetical protein
VNSIFELRSKKNKKAAAEEEKFISFALTSVHTSPVENIRVVRWFCEKIAQRPQNSQKWRPCIFLSFNSMVFLNQPMGSRCGSAVK